MPSVSVLPASPVVTGFSKPSFLSSKKPLPTHSTDMSVAEIRENAVQHAQSVFKTASPLHIIRGARSQLDHARVCDANGDLKGAYAAFTKAGTLARMVMDTDEFKTEMTPGKKGVLWNEFQTFSQNDGRDLAARTKELELKLTQVEQAASSQQNGSASSADGPILKSGGSIADRMRSLQDAGLSVSANKRLSRDLPSTPSALPLSPSGSTSFSSPEGPVSRPNRPGPMGLGLSSPSVSSTFSQTPLLPTSSSQPSQPPQPHSTPTSTASALSPSPHTQAHALIPATSFGPPSPSSSASSSPRASMFNLTEFNQTFPSIDELEEHEGPGSSPQPLAPMSTGASTSSRRSRRDQHNGEQSQRSPIPPPMFSPKPFPIMPVNINNPTGARPASTPVTPNIDSFASRPSSPVAHGSFANPNGNGYGNGGVNGMVVTTGGLNGVNGKSPLSPTIPHKPSNLSLSMKPSRSPLNASLPLAGTGNGNGNGNVNGGLPTTNGVGAGDAKEKVDALAHVKNAAEPRELVELAQKGVKILFLDVRTRDEFMRGRVRGPPVVCIEPTVLARENVNSQMIESSLSIAPREELMLFTNRDKFDLVVVYDSDSSTLGSLASNSPLSVLVKAIYETEFRKILKQVPVLMLGGYEAYKREVGSGTGAGAGEGITEATSTGLAMPPPLSLSMNMNINMNAPPPLALASQPISPSTSTPPTLPSIHEGFQSSTPPASSSANNSSRASPLSSASTGRTRAGTESLTCGSASVSGSGPGSGSGGHSRDAASSGYQDRRSLDQMPGSSTGLARKPALSRPPSVGSATSFSRSISDNVSSPTIPQSMIGSTSIQYPSFGRPNGITSPPPSSSTTTITTATSPHSNLYTTVSPPPQASINHSALSRRRSDYIDNAQEALSNFSSGAGVGNYNSGVGRGPIDYPDISGHRQVLRPPPAAASPALERQDTRPRLGHGHSFSVQVNGVPNGGIPNGGMSMSMPPQPPTIPGPVYAVTYWGDVHIGQSGLRNLGNTCYMNATMQCLSATVPFARFFTEGRWRAAVNMMNKMGTKGAIAQAFAHILHEIWQGEMSFFSPISFRRSICSYASQFAGSEQHDSQEFLSWLLDALHEDLNRVIAKSTYEVTPEREAELEKLPQQIASEQEWRIYRMRNDSIVVDFFQGQFRNRMECMTCHKTSTTYNSFMNLSLPVPTSKHGKITLQNCLDAFVKEEVMEKSDAWNCPNCKVLRKATKQLSLSRLPPVLLIQFKRFSFKGPFTDKIDKHVDFPLKGLELTNYMPPPLPPGVDRGQAAVQYANDDPRQQTPPYKYDLYAVTNHFGSLSSGHYTAFINSRGQWLYCDDSRITPSEAKEVVGKPAYVLYYKRVRS